MNGKYIPPEQTLPAPKFRPSAEGNITYSEVEGRKGNVVIKAYENIAIGQRVVCRLVGNGVYVIPFDIKEIKSEYSESVNEYVLRKTDVTISYNVFLGDDLLYASETSHYKVIGFPTH